MLSVGRHRKSHEFIGETNVREDAFGIVVEVQESATLEIEDAGVLFAKRSTRTQFLEECRYEGKGARASVFHLMNLGAP